MVSSTMTAGDAADQLRPLMPDDLLRAFHRLGMAVGYRNLARAIAALAPKATGKRQTTVEAVVEAIAPPKAVKVHTVKSEDKPIPEPATPIETDGDGMVIRVLQENILAAVNAVYRVVPAQSSLPVCKCIALQTDGGRVRLTATDLETAHVVWAGAQVTVEGGIAIPARALRDGLKGFPKEALTLTVKGKVLTIASDNRRINLTGEDVEDYPPIPKVEGQAFEVDPTALGNAIKETYFAAQTDDSRPTLHAVHCKLESDTMTLAAADGFQLAIHSLHAAGAPEFRECIIPIKALRVLLATLKYTEYPVAVTIGKTQINFDLHERQSITAMLVQGSYPDYAQLIPQSPDHTINVSRKELAEAVNAAIPVARDGSGIVRLAAAHGVLHLSAKAEECGEFNADIPVEMTKWAEAQPCRVAVNSPYLDTMLAAIPDDIVELAVKSPSDPIRIRPVGRDNYTYVVMPIFVSWD